MLQKTFLLALILTQGHAGILMDLSLTNINNFTDSKFFCYRFLVLWILELGSDNIEMFQFLPSRICLRYSQVSLQCMVGPDESRSHEKPSVSLPKPTLLLALQLLELVFLASSWSWDNFIILSREFSRFHCL